MRRLIPLIVFVVAVGTLSGCSAGALPGGPVGGGSAPAPAAAPSSPPAAGAPKAASGSGTSSGTDCAVVGAALKKVVSGPISAPDRMGNVCRFGIGPNAGLGSKALSQQFSDVVDAQYTTDDVDSQWNSANISYADSGVTPLSGVGTKAKYWGGLNNEATPQVWARDSKAFCLVQTHFNSAAEVGLTSPGGSSVIAKSDMPKLAAQFGSICSALFG